MFVDVALSFGTFTYYVPPKLETKIKIGLMVKVPIKSGFSNGFIIRIKESANIKNIKSIKNICYPEPLISPSLIKLSEYLSRYYLANMGSFLELMVPPIGKEKIDAQELSNEITNLNIADLSCPLLIKKSIEERKFKFILIHGENREIIYFSAINEAIKQGLSVIFLLPEINLSLRIYSKLQELFGDLVILYHSRLKKDVRWLNWVRMKQGIKIVVGSKSAVFASVDKLGLIIVDEENDPSYKNEKYPKYSTQYVAIKRAELSDCVCIYGNASPSIESYYKAKDSIIKLYNECGKIHIVDMRKETHPIFSKLLTEKLHKYIKNKEKILLFINRRGFASFLLCEDCGYVPKCKFCGVPLTYHKIVLKCHYCGYEEKPFSTCPICHGINISYKGIGTARVESYIKKLFPEVNIFRVDMDTVSTKYLMRIFNYFISGDVQIFIGAQMLAKSIDFPNVSLVGIISADYGLNLPDFRASERICSIITKLIYKGKEIIIQTHNPKHPVIKHILNYPAFYERELRFRKIHNYPPYSHLIRLVVESKKEKTAKLKAQKLYNKLVANNINILGPAPCFLPHKRNKYRYHLLVKIANPELMSKFLTSGVIYDVDPIKFD